MSQFEPKPTFEPVDNRRVIMLNNGDIKIVEIVSKQDKLLFLKDGGFINTSYVVFNFSITEYEKTLMANNVDIYYKANKRF